MWLMSAKISIKIIKKSEKKKIVRSFLHRFSFLASNQLIAEVKMNWLKLFLYWPTSHALLWDSALLPQLSTHLSIPSTVASLLSSSTVSVEFSMRPSAKVLTSSSHGSRSLSFSISAQSPTLSLWSPVLRIDAAAAATQPSTLTPLPIFPFTLSHLTNPDLLSLGSNLSY